jgi:hypothetical protein
MTERQTAVFMVIVRLLCESPAICRRTLKRKGEILMKKRLLVSGLLVCLLALGLVFVSCGGGGGEYKLEWASFNTTYAAVLSTISGQGWTVEDATDGAYATGDTARDIRTYCINTTSFTDGGSADGSFVGLLEYTKDGIGLPPILKTALATQEANVPLAGIYDGGGFAVVFYVSKN